MYKIVIVYEHKVREMETVLLLKHELIRRGHHVEILHTQEINIIKFLFNSPDLVITPFLYNDMNLRSINYIFGRIKKICNLQWEQVYNGSGNSEHKRTPCGNAKKAVHFCWGENSFNRLKRNGITHAILTGAPQLDFLKCGFEHWYMDRETLFNEYNINSETPTILFISSFSYLGLTDEVLKEINALTDIDAFYFKKITEESRDAILSWFERFLSNNSKVNIIYRPHPGEPYDAKIDKLCKKYKNMYNIPDYSVKQWIKVCDLILNWYSTAGVEAFFANKSNLFLRPLRLPENLEYEMFQNVCTAYNYSEFETYLNNASLIDNFYVKYPLVNKIKPYYLVDKAYSFDHIVDAVEEMLTSTKYDIEIFSYKGYYRWKFHISSFINYILYILCKNKTLSKFFQNIKKLEKRIKCINNQTYLNVDKITKNEEMQVEEKIQKIFRQIGRI